MNRQLLRDLLDTERIRHDAYALDGTAPEECLCLVPGAGGWIVFYSERGTRTGEHWFETEDEACSFMADRLLANYGNRED